jgi:hypothetical protein
MSSKEISPTDEPVEVFRQFAWHLAGKLADSPDKAVGKPVAKPRPVKAAGRR